MADVFASSACALAETRFAFISEQALVSDDSP